MGRLEQRSVNGHQLAPCQRLRAIARPVTTALLRSLRPPWISDTAGMRSRRPRPSPAAHSAFAGFRFPPDGIVLAVRWYLRFGLSYRDVEELLAERGVEVDHVSIYPVGGAVHAAAADAAKPCRHTVGDRWFVDETDVKVAGRWRYVDRAIDQFGQVIDVFVSPPRDTKAARRFFQRAIGAIKVTPVEVTTGQAPVYPAVLEALVPVAWHRTDRYANDRVACDHGRLKARLRPMRGLEQDRSARVIVAGHAFVQNLRRGHRELAVEVPATRRPGGWQWRSASWPWRSDLRRGRSFSMLWVGTTQQRPRGSEPASSTLSRSCCGGPSRAGSTSPTNRTTASPWCSSTPTCDACWWSRPQASTPASALAKRRSHASSPTVRRTD